MDSLIDFSQYDNWTRESDYNHTNEPDDTVDMIVMVWRGKPFTDAWAGEASLGRGADLSLDGVTIARGYPGFSNESGSGITVQFFGDRSEDYSFKTIVHELGHWLISGTHPYGGGEPQHSIWGMLTSNFDGDLANPFERERLG